MKSAALNLFLIFALALGQTGTPAPVDADLCRYAPSGDYLARGDYLVAFDGSRRTFRWALEMLSRQSLTGTAGPRPGFKADPDIPQEFAVADRDYDGALYDRGHGAPDADHLRTREYQVATYTLANVMPQNPNLNRGTWGRLEQYVRDVARAPGVRRVFVVTAPAWISDGSYQSNGVTVSTMRVKMIGRAEVWVPNFCAKSCLIEYDDGHFTALSYLVPNRDDAKAKFDEYRVSVNRIESVVGLNLWKGIPGEEALESLK